MSIIIRKGKLSDISNIHHALNHTNELRDYGGDDEEYPKTWVRGVVENKSNNLVLVAEDNKKFVGFTIVHLLKGASDGLAHSLYVVPSYRRKGIASRLLQNREYYLKNKGYKFVIGLVNVSNKKMQNFMFEHNYNKGNKFYVYWKVLP